MKSEQLSVFLENRAGRLAEVTHTLAEAGVNIRALSLADTSDFGILRLIVCNHEKAQMVLKEKGFTLGRTHVVAVEVPDQPGGLDAILQLMSANNINVEYMYAFTYGRSNKAIIVFRFENPEKAIAMLKDEPIELVRAEELF